MTNNIIDIYKQQSTGASPVPRIAWLVYWGPTDTLASVSATVDIEVHYYAVFCDRKTNLPSLKRSAPSNRLQLIRDEEDNEDIVLVKKEAKRPASESKLVKKKY